MLPQRNVNWSAAPLHSTAADRRYIVYMAWDRLGRSDNHHDRVDPRPFRFTCLSALYDHGLHFSLYPLPHSPRRVLPRWPLRAVQMVITWRQQYRIGCHGQKNIARYRYYPIHANIAQYPITKYRYRSNPNFRCSNLVCIWYLCNLYLYLCSVTAILTVMKLTSTYIHSYIDVFRSWEVTAIHICFCMDTHTRSLPHRNTKEVVGQHPCQL